MTYEAQQVQIVKTLNRIEHELQMFKKEVMNKIEELEDEVYYPIESQIKKSYIKKIAKIEKEMKKGKYHTYKSIKDLDAAIKATI